MTTFAPSLLFAIAVARKSGGCRLPRHLTGTKCPEGRPWVASGRAALDCAVQQRAKTIIDGSPRWRRGRSREDYRDKATVEGLMSDLLDAGGPEPLHDCDSRRGYQNGYDHGDPHEAACFSRKYRPQHLSAVRHVGYPSYPSSAGDDVVIVLSCQAPDFACVL